MASPLIAWFCQQNYLLTLVLMFCPITTKTSETEISFWDGKEAFHIDVDA